jgi:hypothetical protein
MTEKRYYKCTECGEGSKACYIASNLTPEELQTERCIYTGKKHRLHAAKWVECHDVNEDTFFEHDEDVMLCRATCHGCDKRCALLNTNPSFIMMVAMGNKHGCGKCIGTDKHETVWGTNRDPKEIVTKTLCKKMGLKEDDDRKEKK